MSHSFFLFPPCVCPHLDERCDLLCMQFATKKKIKLVALVTKGDHIPSWENLAQNLHSQAIYCYPSKLTIFIGYFDEKSKLSSSICLWKCVNQLGLQWLAGKFRFCGGILAGVQTGLIKAHARSVRVWYRVGVYVWCSGAVLSGYVVEGGCEFRSWSQSVDLFYHKE